MTKPIIIKKWKIKSSIVLLDDARIRVVEDRIILPNGSTTTYLHTPSVNDSVIIIAVNDSGELLIQREYSHPPSKIMWQLPGGSMNDGETPELAANRELSEESGYKSNSIEIIGNYFTNNRRSNQIQYVLLCRDLYESKEEEDHDEFIISEWLSISKIKEMIKAGEVDNINMLAALNILWTKKLQ